MATINIFAIEHDPANLTLAQVGERVKLKYCELCGMLCVLEKQSKMCARCFTKLPDLMKKMQHDDDVKDVITAERLRFRKPREILHTPHAKRSESACRARRAWAPWRFDLMEAFKTKPEMTAKEICAIMGHHSRDASMSVAVARNAGLPIVVARTETYFNKNVGAARRRKLYTISSAPNPAPLTPPQDPVTHQFMKEVQ